MPALGELRRDGRGGHDSAHRVAVAHRLPERDDVGHDVVLGEAPERLADPPEARLHLVGDAQRPRRTGPLVRGAEVAGRYREDAVAREHVVADEQRRSVSFPTEKCESVIDLVRHAFGGVGGREGGGTSDPRHPRLECCRPELLGRQSSSCRRGAVVGVLGDHGPAASGHSARDLDRDVVRLAARVDEHHDGELAGEQRDEPVGVGSYLVDEVAGVRGQPPRLRGERCRDPRVGVPHLWHVVVGVEQPVPVYIHQPDAVARLEAHGLLVAQGERRSEPRAPQSQALGEGWVWPPEHAARLRERDGERRRAVVVDPEERCETVLRVGEDVVDVVRVQLGPPGGDEEGLGHPGRRQIGNELELRGRERSDGVVGGQDIDEGIERVVAAECLVGRSDRGVDHRPRVDEISEVDDAGDVLRVVAVDKQIAGVDVAVDRRERHEGECGLDHRLVAVEPALDEPSPVGREMPEPGAQFREPRHVPQEGMARQRVREAGERPVEPCDRGTDSTASAWAGGAGREGGAVDEGDELDGVVGAVDRDRTG